MGEPTFYTMWLQCPGEEFRQYGFHLGTIFEVAKQFCEERANWWVKQGGRVQLRHGDAVIQVWPHAGD